MGDDQLHRASDRELFHDIVRHLVDPELKRLRLTFLVLCVVLYSVAAGIIAWSGLGWLGLLAFSSTFVPSVLIALVLHRRRFTARLATANSSLS